MVLVQKYGPGSKERGFGSGGALLSWILSSSLSTLPKRGVRAVSRLIPRYSKLQESSLNLKVFWSYLGVE